MFEKIMLFLYVLTISAFTLLVVIWLFIEASENTKKQNFCKENFLHKPVSEVPMWCVTYLK